MAEEEKTNTLDKKPPEGTPSSEAGKEKLLAGKYKSAEELEKGYQELQTKYTQDMQRKAETEQALTDFRAKLKETGIRQTEEEKQRLEQDMEAMGKEFSEEAKKGPKEMMRSLYKLIEAHPSVEAAVKRGELKRKTEEDQKATKIFNEFRDGHKDDFDKLKPEMAKIWAELPAKSKVPEMLETVYKAAKADAFPSEEALRKKMAEEAKAGTTQVGGEKPKPEIKSKDNKDIDAVIEVHKKAKIM